MQALCFGIVRKKQWAEATNLNWPSSFKKRLFIVEKDINTLKLTFIYRFAFLSGGKINVFPTPSPLTLCEGQIVETSVDTVHGQDVVIHIIIIEFKHEWRCFFMFLDYRVQKVPIN